MSSFESSELDRRLLERRQILIGEPISDTVAQAVIAKMLYFDQQDRNTPVHLFINSPGGSITASLAIFDTMGFVRCPIYPVAMEVTVGAAIWLLAAGERGHRQVMENSYLSIEVTSAAPSQGLDISSRLRALNLALAKKFAEKTELSESDVFYALRTGRSFSPAEAISAGIADVVAGPVKIEGQ